MPGLYLGLEGVEGAGKSTVALATAREADARGRQVVTVREPGTTRLGEEIRRLLLHGGDMAGWAEAALFTAQRAQLVVEVVAPALSAGAWVVSDRTYYSSLAYQGAARKLGVGAVRIFNELALGAILPDLVVVLDVDPVVGLGRQQASDRIGGEGLDFQREVAAAYRLLAEEEPSRVTLLDASRPPDELARVIVDLAEERWRG